MSVTLFACAWLLALVDLVSCDQNSSNIGFWDRPRAAIIRDHVYLEGGYMQTGVFESGVWSDLKITHSTDGFLYKLSLHESFDTTAANPAIFQSIDEGPVTNFYFDGFMFADYDELYAYGGMYLFSGDAVTGRTVSVPLYDPAPGSNVQEGVPNTGYSPQSGSFITDITNGAGANAPSENKGFYFSGKYNANGTAFSSAAPPTDMSPWFITVDTTLQGHAVWSRDDLTTHNVTLRLEGGLVWVPTSTQGILVYIGGVTYASDLSIVPTTNTTLIDQGKSFLTEFDIYDIGSGQWSKQALNPSSPIPPGPLAQFCTVVASSEDGSHHDIFVYGGWDSNGGMPSQEVWILSIPSFTWVRASSDGGSARQGHVCVSPYPDQMMVIGGTGAFGGGFSTNNSVDVFNLNSLTWTGKYDPDTHASYTPNAKVMSAISATPTVSGMSSQVSGWFTTPYPGTIRSFGPFKEEPRPGSANGTATPTPTPKPHHDRKWVIPVAVVVPIVVVGAILAGLIFFCLRRNKKRRNQQATSEADSAHKSKSWILPWVYSTSGSQAAGKDIATDSSITEVEHGAHSPQPMTQAHHELDAGGAGYFRGSSDIGGNQERWSNSTNVRSPRYAYAGPVEGMNTEVHEVDGSARVAGPDDINYDFRNMAMYPPSVVSRGADTSRDVPSSSVSQSGDSVTPASPQSHSVMASSGFAPIHEGEAASGGGHMSPYRAISPIDLRGGPRPTHQRKESDVSDIGTSPLPSPNPDVDEESVQPGRPRPISRSVSGDEIDEHEKHARAL
ncbi:hypothetical protein H2200_013482 [Cladophialophora chaetospira]|uniref:Kelch repeat protein n=1 Tax=Cladophialophora chaetospira TaxID=386627 RepID=A0AA38WPF0_9EURO|nr:hypothetical protein H2200_013482 [Cladophialophora chaetospira]